MAKRLTDGEPWRIGVLFSQTGVTAVIEETQLRGTIMAIEEVNAAGGVNGRELVPVVYDPASESRNFARFADKMLTEDGISTIFGCYTSSSRKAVLPVVERRNGLLWYPTLYEGFEYSPNIIYTGAAPNQNSVELVDFLLETYGRRFYLIGSDYIYPRESNRIMRELGPINPAAPAFPLAAAAMASLRAGAESEGSSDFTPLWAGQNASACREIPAAVLTRELAARPAP